MKTAPGRRFALMTMGLGMVAGAAGLAALHDGAASAAEPSLLPPEAKSLEDRTARLCTEPHRRDKSILTAAHPRHRPISRRRSSPAVRTSPSKPGTPRR